MRVTLKLYTVLREIVGKGFIEIRLNDVATVEELISSLTDIYGKKFEENVFGKRPDQLQIFILINAKDIRELNGLDTPLKNGDRIVFLPLIAGG